MQDNSSFSYDQSTFCPRCACKKIISDDQLGELLCASCGVVLSEKNIDSAAEWRNFQGDANKSRVGSSTSLAMQNYGLDTIINEANRDSVGRTLSATTTKSFKRLRKWNKRTLSRNVSERNMKYAFEKLGLLQDKLVLSDAVIEKAAYIYRKLLEKRLIQGRSISAMICASVYAACRDSSTPRTLRDITKASNVRRKEITTCYRLLLRELNLKMPVIDYKQSVARIANNAGMSEKTKRFAFGVLQKAQKKGIVAGKDPSGLAASALYLSGLACGDTRSQKEIAIAANTSEVTIRNRNKTLENFFGFSTRNEMVINQ